MKTITAFSLILLCFKSNISFAQYNLVPNPSFEDTLACPLGVDQLDFAVGWSSYRNSPDYFNSCATNGMSVPNNNCGYQFAHSGNAYCGLVTYRNPLIQSNYREFAGVQLLSPTIIGQHYYISFFVNFAFGTSISIATNKIGCTLSLVQYSKANPAPINNQSILHMDSVLTDSVSWIKLSGSFTATDNFQYLIIGNFYDDVNTDTLVVRPANNISYYYIDDVCLSTDSAYCDTWTGINEVLHDNNISIIPNPANTFFQINGIQGELEIKIYDVVGKLALDININNNLLNIESISNGIYLIKINSQNKSIIKKIIIQH
jgi:hypothetical protein